VELGLGQRVRLNPAWELGLDFLVSFFGSGGGSVVRGVADPVEHSLRFTGFDT